MQVGGSPQPAKAGSNASNSPRTPASKASPRTPGGGTAAAADGQTVGGATTGQSRLVNQNQNPSPSAPNSAASTATKMVQSTQQQQQLENSLRDDLGKWHLYHQMRTKGITLTENAMPEM